MVNVDLYTEIVTWLKCLKGWQTELAYRIMSGDLTDKDYEDVIKMLKESSSFTEKDFPVLTFSSSGDFRLKSISDVNGIGKLNSKKALSFDENKNLSIVYGLNGSGKSGYVKILKKASGKPYAEEILGNVFKKNETLGNCSITYTIGHSEKMKKWKVSDPHIEDMHSVSIFDSKTGSGYITNKNTISYIPQIVRFFEDFSFSVTKISEILHNERFKILSVLPKMPSDLRSTIIGQKYISLSSKMSKNDIEEMCKFNEDDQNEIIELENRLKITDYTKEKSSLQNKILEIEKLILELQKAEYSISIKNVSILKSLYDDIILKRKNIEEGYHVMDDEYTNLNGIGTETWMSLWNAAREFSTKQVYPNMVYPYVGEKSHCVLCGQELSDEAKKRLISFEDYVKGKLGDELKKAKEIYEEALRGIPEIINQDVLKSKAHAGGLDEKETEILFERWKRISELTNNILSSDYSKVVGINQVNPEEDSFIKSLRSKIEICNNRLNQIKLDESSQNKESLLKRLRELKCLKFCKENHSSIENELRNLKLVDNLEKWISECNTRNISNKSSEISTRIITKEYIDRFNSELKVLGAGHLKVTIIPSIQKGVPKYSLSLIGADGKIHPDLILSEGEARIVSLASFLADVTGSECNSTFIFDDPISSLDQTFEDKVANRLVNLSKKRQVIVFTHRLSLLSILCDLEENCETICLSSEYWGSGNVGEIPLNAKDPIKSLNSIKNDRLPKAKKVFEENGTEFYYPLQKSICGDIRITIERIVEKWMLADVVQRFRRAVNTQGKIEKLSKITKEDCKMVNDLMTKYSFPEHSQPIESPLSPFLPADIDKDLDTIISWVKDLKQRMK